jgi:hypothetical protein
MVGYVTDLKLTAGLTGVLADVCDKEDCSHIPFTR